MDISDEEIDAALAAARKSGATIGWHDMLDALRAAQAVRTKRQSNELLPAIVTGLHDVRLGHDDSGGVYGYLPLVAECVLLRLVQ